jgi:hypothetical protein
MVLGTINFGSAAALGFGLHLLTGALLGAAAGFVLCRIAMMKFLNPYKAVGYGMVVGIAVWFVLFLPVTLFFVQPSMSKISVLLAQSIPKLGLSPANAIQPISGIALGAIAFHLIWGAIFGYMASAFLRVKAFRLAHPKKNKDENDFEQGGGGGKGGGKRKNQNGREADLR